MKASNWLGALSCAAVFAGTGGAGAIEVKTPVRTLNFDGKTYLLNFALPNFYFHLTMAFAILRHNGLEVGKLDYLGA